MYYTILYQKKNIFTQHFIGVEFYKQIYNYYFYRLLDLTNY